MSGPFHDRWPWRKTADGHTVLDVVPRWLRWGIGGLLLILALGGMMIRTADHDPARWHVDPLTAERSARPNDAIAASPGIASAEATRPLGIFDAAPDILLARLRDIALAEPRTAVVDGSAEAGHMTFVQRSALFGFPDYVSAKATPMAEGTGLAVWSRSRYGYSDMGVNAARLERWLAALSAAE